MGLTLFKIFVFILLLVIVGILRTLYRSEQRYLKSRHIKPAMGQVWMDLGTEIKILHIHSSGNVTLRNPNSISPETESRDLWESRLHERQRYLVKDVSHVVHN